ncbi:MULTISPECIES: hypothetical protein [unclassified Wolbachia]|uniref:hypothetical protein n=1 Tax=unclassified Wolbachia TaxID=2640676 RepID=UPI00223076D5|nr:MULTISPECIES: hypothetical protein [unclassified Wolbachia]
MKKYLKYIKTLQLAKGILAGSIFLSSYCFADENYLLSGKVTSMSDNFNYCGFILDNYQQPGIKIYNRIFCDFIRKARDFDQKVTVEMIGDPSTIDSITKLKGVRFLDRNSSWFTNKDGIEESYSLKGNIEDIYYNAVNSRCYIAINDPRPSKTKYNNKFHETNSKSICELAEDAFYLGLKVEIQASLDPHPDYANDIRILKLVNSCSNLRSH